MEIDGKMRKTSETMENVGNNRKHRKQQKMSETTENVGKQQNVGNVGIGTGGNMVHDNVFGTVSDQNDLDGSQIAAAGHGDDIEDEFETVRRQCAEKCARIDSQRSRSHEV